MEGARQKYYIVWLSLAAAFLSVYSGFFYCDAGQLKRFYVYYTWYFLAAALVLFLQKAAVSLPDIQVIREHCKKHAPAMLLAVFITVCMWHSCKPEFRILADETNLAAVSQSLFEERTCKNVTQTRLYYHGFRETLAWELDHRPAFYPFLGAVLHSLTGYRVENLFFVNAVSGALSLFFTYLLVYFVFGRFWGIISMGLLASYPVFALYTMSGGFEALNLTLALLSALLMLYFIKKPGASTFELLLLSLPLLAQTRYESAAAIFCVFLIMPFVMPRNEYSRFSWRLVIYPALFLPVAWQRMATFTAGAFQVSDASNAFTFGKLYQNIVNAVEYFLGYELQYGAVPIIALMAAAGLIVFLYFSFANKERMQKNDLYMWGYVLLFYICHGAARFAFHWGNLKLQYISRMGLIFLPLIVYFAVYFLFQVSRSVKYMRSWAVIFAAMLPIVYWPVSGQNMAVRDIEYYREYKTVSEYLQRNFPDKESYILVSSLSNLFVPTKYNTISIDYLRRDIEGIKASLKRKTWQYLIVVQQMFVPTSTPMDGFEVPPGMKLQTLYESQLTADKFIRISAYYPPECPKNALNEN